MSGVIDVISRPVGEGDISFGANSFVYVDINGVSRRVNQVNAGSIPWLSIPSTKVEALVDGSKNLPVGASNLAVVGTSIFSGPVYVPSTTSGLVFNNAGGQLLFGQAVPVAAIPTGIPAPNIGSGTVSNAEFGYLDGATSNIQVQINAIASSASAIHLEHFAPPPIPNLVYSTATTVYVTANAASPAWIRADGFPDQLNPGLFVTGGISNSQYYSVTAQTSFVMTGNTYGTEKASQWYAIYAESSGSAFNLLGMPFLRWKSEASQVIRVGTNSYPNTDGVYGFTPAQFVGGQLYILSGAAQGQLRTITANTEDSGYTAITYSGAVLGMSQGDWFIVIPPSVNFRWIGDVFNDASSNIQPFVKRGNVVQWYSGINDTSPGYVDAHVLEYVQFVSPLAKRLTMTIPNVGTSAFVGPPECLTGPGNGAIQIPIDGSGTFGIDYCRFYLFYTTAGRLYPCEYHYLTGHGY